MCLKFVSGSHVLRSHDKLLRTIVLGADLQDEVAWGGSRQIRRSPSFFSSKRGFAGAWDVVAELDCAHRV